jgi:hypothetical protein
MTRTRRKQLEQSNSDTRQITVTRSGLCDSDVVRIADEVETRILKLWRPDPALAIPEGLPRHIDPDDLLTPQQAAHLIGKSDQTIYRWIPLFDISICIAGTVFVSRRKFQAHLARRSGHNDP